MSASPGAYVTSVPQATWIKIRKGRLVWFLYGTFTSSVSYITVPPYHEMPSHIAYNSSSNQTMNYLINLLVYVTAVSGTSPALTVSVNYVDLFAYLNGVTTFYGAFTVPSSGSISSTGQYGGYAYTNFMYAYQIVVNVSGTSPSFTAYITFEILS